jgi:hypothetical protein
MSWKAVVVLIGLAAAGYGAYRYLAAREARTDLCAKLARCSPPRAFAEEYGSVDECADGEAGARALARFADCPLELSCDEWIACGYDLGAPRSSRGDPDHKTNFEQVLPALSD